MTDHIPGLVMEEIGPYRSVLNVLICGYKDMFYNDFKYKLNFVKLSFFNYN